MTRFILKRLLLLIPVLIGVTFVVFVILSMAPGDPVLVLLGDGASEEAVAKMRAELGLDDPLMVRYGNYIWGILHGDFGKSYKTRVSVADELMSRFPNTLILAGCGMVLSILLGIPLGIISAKRQGTVLESTLTFSALVAVSMPNFWLGLLGVAAVCD